MKQMFRVKNEDELRASAKWLFHDLTIRDPLPTSGFQMTERMCLVLLAQACGMPNVVDRERDAHRAEAHAGQDGNDDCAECGWFDAAVYSQRTGRSLSQDFFSDRS